MPLCPPPVSGRDHVLGVVYAWQREARMRKMRVVAAYVGEKAAALEAKLRAQPEYHAEVSNQRGYLVDHAVAWDLVCVRVHIFVAVCVCVCV